MNAREEIAMVLIICQISENIASCGKNRSSLNNALAPSRKKLTGGLDLLRCIWYNHEKSVK